MRSTFFLICFLTVLSSASLFSQHELSPEQIVRQMYAKTKEINSLSYNMRKKERIKETLPLQETEVRMVMNPFKVYLKQKSPKEGLQVLYVNGTNGNKAIVNTNGFPWVNLNLDPMGSVMRENQHHTIFESGYAYLMSILEHLSIKYHSEISTLVSKSGSIKWDQHDCWVIALQNPHFKYITYTVQKNETVLSIAKKLMVSEHMIVEKNSLADFTSIKPGQTISVPNDYSPKLELYIDKQRFIPLVMKVYDDKGLYEYYEYSNVKINPSFPAQEFTKENPSYGF